MNLKLFKLALCCLLACAIMASAENVAQINVATYNLRQKNQKDSIDGNGWDVRYPALAGLVRFHEFNIFGTQEGFKRQLEDLKGMLPGYEYIGVARDDGKEKGEFCAIFYDTAMFELLDHGNFWLSETPDRPGLGWDAACVRICTWGKFRHKPSGKVFRFFNLHLDHIGKKARTESVRLVWRKVKEAGLDMPTFLTGDFNVDQNNELYDVLSSADFMADAFKKAEFVYALNGTFNSYKTDGYSESRIDHIFVSDGVTVEKYGVLTDTYRTPADKEDNYELKDFPEELKLKAFRSRVPSDHFPVEIKVKF